MEFDKDTPRGLNPCDNYFNNFYWGDSTPWYIETIKKEIFEDKIYEKFYQVNEGDFIVDVGASTGPFLYSIFPKNPGRCIAIEPFRKNYPALEINCSKFQVEIVKHAIGSEDSVEITWEGETEIVKSISFSKFIRDYSLEKIDFLKIDCEGGEYEIFSEDNLDWITENVKYCVGEWHLSNSELKLNFKKIRDSFFKNLEINGNSEIKVYSVDGVDIKWDLFNDHFIDYYTEVIIHIKL